MADLFVPSFSWFKTKWQNYIREDHYFDILLQSDLSMFRYENLPSGLDPVWIEKYLNIAGSIAITKTPEEYQSQLLPERPAYVVAAIPSRDGAIDQYGDGCSVSGSTDNGCSVRGTIGVDAAIIYNRDTRMPELDLMIDADALTQIDKSAAINVILSRLAPVYNCTNKATQKAMDEVLSRIIDGNVMTVLSGNVSDLLKNEIGMELIEITHPEKIQYIQYLSQYYDVILRRHYNRRGLSVRTGTKAAQQSQDEIHGLDAVSWILPLAKLRSRQEGFDMFNRIYGENVTVSFSELWQQEYDAYQLRILQQDSDAEQQISEDAADAAQDPDDQEGGDSDAETSEE